MEKEMKSQDEEIKEMEQPEKAKDTETESKPEDSKEGAGNVPHEKFLELKGFIENEATEEQLNSLSSAMGARFEILRKPEEKRVLD